VTTDAAQTVALSISASADARSLRERPGIGVLGYGNVARRWQVPSYVDAGLNVVAICDTDPEARDAAHQACPWARLYDSAEDLLADPDVVVVDLATRPPGRLALIERAVMARCHVLAQKPLGADPADIDRLLALAQNSGATVAVNQNGRFAPAWRVTTSLLRSGRLGRIRAITHMYDTNLRWRPNPGLQGTNQFLLFDYSNHWIDICGYWLEPDPVVAVQAMAYEVAAGNDGLVQQSMWASLESASGVSVVIRGAAAGTTHAGHRFIVQGERGTVRGDVDSVDGEYVEVDEGNGPVRQSLDGAWFPDGFLGSMVHLLRSIEEGREPEHSLADNRRTVALVAAACQSARESGRRVEVAGSGQTSSPTVPRLVDERSSGCPGP
jgi:predicted dehydrogenase